MRTLSIGVIRGFRRVRSPRCVVGGKFSGSARRSVGGIAPPGDPEVVRIDPNRPGSYIGLLSQPLRSFGRFYASASPGRREQRREQQPETAGKQQEQQAFAHRFVELVFVTLECHWRGHPDQTVTLRIKTDAHRPTTRDAGQAMQGGLARGRGVGYSCGPRTGRASLRH